MSPKLIYSVLALLILILAVRMADFLLGYNPLPLGSNITFETQVLTQPKLSSTGQRVSLIMPNSQRVSVLFSLDPVISYGDIVKLEGNLEYFEAENGDKVPAINYPQFEIVKKSNSGFYRLRDKIIDFFNSNLSPSQSALALGIVFGIKQEMPKDFYEDLQKSGVMHVVAASGMNVTMVGGFLLSSLGLFLRRQWALVGSIIGISFYAFMAGFEPSIVRASIMGILVFSSQIFGRQNSSFLGLFGAGFAMLFINPSLIFDIGFQLSFLATLGLIYLRPLFYLNNKLKTIIKKSFIGEDIATTITAQIFTLPILIVNFGSYSLISILVNAIALWTVPLIMVIGGAAMFFAVIFEPLGRLILYLNLPFLLYFEEIVSFFGGLGGQIEVKSIPILVFCGYYLILLSLIISIRKKS